jgi:hypothetical protein
MLMTSAFARTTAAQFVAHWSGIALFVEDLPPVVIGRPPAAAAVVPAGDPCVVRIEAYAVWHCAPLFPLERVPSRANFERRPILNTGPS